MVSRAPYEIMAADARAVLELMGDNSVDSIVTDPPYALVSVVKRFGKTGAAPAKHGADGLYARASAGFMGEKWDTGEVVFAESFWRECLRVLKPGGHVLAMGGTRTYHRLACAIEDAGFDVRDQLAWVYGTGFPKSHDEGDGRGTALKPAWEPICLARKNLSEKTIALNLAKWGTGALWIDRSRVLTEDNLNGGAYAKGGRGGKDLPGANRTAAAAGLYAAGASAGEYIQPGGRWPANILHDGSSEVLEAFPQTKDGGGAGSVTRFFYCAKASAADRDEGLEDFAKQRSGGMTATLNGSMKTGSGNDRTTTRANFHPTVKPTPLMGWQIGLVTPPGGVVFDPFMGSGSTGKAAIRGGFQFIGCDSDPRYVEISRARLDFEVKKRAETGDDDY